METVTLKFNPAVLRDAWKTQGISATLLAQRTGIHRSTIYMILRGEQKVPSAEHVATIAYALCVPLHTVFYLEDICSNTEKPVDKLQ